MSFIHRRVSCRAAPDAPKRIFYLFIFLTLVRRADVYAALFRAFSLSVYRSFLLSGAPSFPLSFRIRPSPSLFPRVTLAHARLPFAALARDSAAAATATAARKRRHSQTKDHRTRPRYIITPSGDGSVVSSRHRRVCITLAHRALMRRAFTAAPRIASGCMVLKYFFFHEQL